MKSFSLKKTALIVCLIIFASFCFSCKKKEAKKVEESTETINKDPFFKLSLAQWSLNKSVRFENADPLDFAKRASELGFEGIEYVSHLYSKKIDSLGMDSVLVALNTNSKKYNVQNLLIMIDGEGELASPDENKRKEAVEKHKIWVDAANTLGCHSIRVNLFGTNDADEWVTTAAQGLKELSEYAATKNINVIVENHGGLSSDASLLAQVMKNVGMNNCGTLPDFGNFCMKRENGEPWGSPCIEEYDKYKGVQELMPYAKAVSAKSYDFDENGNETKIDYKRMMQIVKDAGYTGFVGVEYEGDSLSEVDGIKATKELLLNVAKELN